jgi:hypothetical protein
MAILRAMLLLRTGRAGVCTVTTGLKSDIPTALIAATWKENANSGYRPRSRNDLFSPRYISVNSSPVDFAIRRYSVMGLPLSLPARLLEASGAGDADELVLVAPQII